MSYEIFNWSAFLFLFIAYVLLLKGIFTAQNYIYLGMQLVGGTSFVIVGIYVNAWSVWMFNGVWIIATLIAIISNKKKVLVIKDLKKLATEILEIAAADDVRLIQEYLETAIRKKKL